MSVQYPSFKKQPNHHAPDYVWLIDENNAVVVYNIGGRHNLNSYQSVYQDWIDYDTITREEFYEVFKKALLAFQELVPELTADDRATIESLPKP